MATQILPLSIEDTVRLARAIVVVRLESSRSEWVDGGQRRMRTLYDGTVEDVVLSDGAITAGGKITLEYWGGRLEGRIQEIADVSLPAPGRYVMMLSSGRTATPVVGLTQGMLRIVSDRTTNTDVVEEFDGRPLRTSALDLVGRHTSAQTLSSKVVPLRNLLAALRADLDSIKRTAPVPPMPPTRTPMAFPRRTANRSVVGRSTSVNIETGVPILAGAAMSPIPAEPAGYVAPTRAAHSNSGPSIMYARRGRADLPIVINQLPADFTPWAGEDVKVLARWNHYAEIFHKRVTPSPTYAWGDGVFDVVGWPSTQELQDEYGSSWAPNVIAVTFMDIVPHLPDFRLVIEEADVALNPDFDFTLDDEWIYSGAAGNVQSFRMTMMHEFGHVWGALHNFNDLSIMNYLPTRFSGFSLPYMDDAQNVRTAYAGWPRTDLGIYLYFADNAQSARGSTLPFFVTSGQELLISAFHLENVGTTTVQTPTVEWYLTPARNFLTYTFLGTRTFAALPPFTKQDPATALAILDVPIDVTPGNYYVAAFIRNDEGATQETFPFSNNAAFSLRSVRIDAAQPQIHQQPQGQTLAAGSSAMLSIGVSGTPTIFYQWYRGAAGNTTDAIAGAIASSYSTGALSQTTSYWVRVQNVAGGIDSDTATVHIFQPFIDHALSIGSAIKAVHIEELRTRINVLRKRFGLLATMFEDSPLTPQVTRVRATHIVELQQSVREVLLARGVFFPAFSSIEIGGWIRMVHISELREAVLLLEN
jgi:hypothetical protein